MGPSEICFEMRSHLPDGLLGIRILHPLMRWRRVELVLFGEFFVDLFGNSQSVAISHICFSVFFPALAADCLVA